MGTDVESKWLGIEDALAYSGLGTRRALYGWVKRNQVKAHKAPDGRYRFLREDLDAAMTPILCVPSPRSGRERDTPPLRQEPYQAPSEVA